MQLRSIWFLPYASSVNMMELEFLYQNARIASITRSGEYVKAEIYEIILGGKGF